MVHSIHLLVFLKLCKVKVKKNIIFSKHQTHVTNAKV